MTLRLRLTLWYSTVLAIIIVLFGMAVYGLVTASLTLQIDQTLEQAAEDIIRASSANPLLATVTIPPNLDRFGGPNVYAQVWKVDGSLANQTQSLGSYAEPLDADALGHERAGLREAFISGAHLRVFTSPMLTADGRLVGYVQTATSLRVVDIARSRLLVVLVAGGALAVLLATLVGWFSASRALRPIEQVTQTALQITRADDLSRRVELSRPPNDEVGRLAMAFNESLERLERLFTAQRRFLADVSHELRTPLTTIRGNVDLLRRLGTVDAVSLDAIQSEAERMSRLVGDLLLLAQADAGNLPLVLRPVDLDTLLLEVGRETQVLAGGARVGVGEIDQIQIMGDRDRLKQLLLNLVSNAAKFTPEGGRITLGLARVNNHARLTVTDTGLGIPPDELPHVFDRFYRVDKARSRAQGGAGLGLSIAQRIAHLHGGRIEVSSDGVPGHGTTFSVWLPLSPDRAQPAPPAASPVPADSRTPHHSR